MIKKYIDNTAEVRQRLIEMLMEDAKDMCNYQRDIYMYIDDNGRASLEWFVNVGGNSWIDDDHILLHRCRQHYEGIEDSIDGTAMLADILDMSSDELCDAVCWDQGIDRDDLQYADCISWAFAYFGDHLREWYDECIEDAASDYAEQADEIMRGDNRLRLDEAYQQQEITDIVPIVWLFVLTTEDQRALDKQRGDNDDQR